MQKQISAGQRTRFRVFVATGGDNGRAGLGVKCSEEVATIILGPSSWPSSLLSLCGKATGDQDWQAPPVPCKVTSCCGSVLVHLIPAPRGTGICSAPVLEKLVVKASVHDHCASARGCTATLGNFAKATFHAVPKAYGFLTLACGRRLFTRSP
ncbi:small ribosomal subunit protein uS5-like [Molossus nigricans]